MTAKEEFEKATAAPEAPVNSDNVTPEATTEAVPPSSESAEAPEADEGLTAALAAAEEKASEHWNRLLQKEAELQNFARRARQELDNAKKSGPDKLAQDLIAVMDSLDQGIETAPQTDETKSVVEGLVLVRKTLLDTLKKYEVKLIDPMNEAFNPDQHEAIAAQPNGEVAPNTILVVVQKGYLIRDRLLRPARVIVSSAGTAKSEEKS